MDQIEILDRRRRRIYLAHLIVLSAYFLILFVEWLVNGWINPGSHLASISTITFWLRIIYLPAIILNLVLEIQISRHKDARKALGDEMDTIHRLRSWRNAFFATIGMLLVLTILSESKAPASASRVMSMVILFGCSMFFLTYLVLGREE